MEERKKQNRRLSSLIFRFSIREKGRKMRAKTLFSLLSLIPYVVRTALSLFFLWLTLGWKARKGRKAFERQLTAEGIPKEHVKRLGRQYIKLKNDLVNAVKQSMFSGGRGFFFSFNVEENL
ncbi:hypothetical protein DRO50_01785 [Candidatus Bathyarchaeota archaeon]|nr:MAG: hypothetical protein DRO50_01785 [Candidatus Bathyarchaeota archaeon]